jgi:hypothetical protein
MSDKNKNIKLLLFSPGAGGNFLSRILNIHPDISVWVPKEGGTMPIDPQKRFSILSYPFTSRVDNTWKKYWRSNWINFEDELKPADNHDFSINHQNWSGELIAKVWCRITISTREEWRWMVGNAHWKNSLFSATYLKSSLLGEQDHAVPLKDLWSWNSLSQHIDILVRSLGYKNITEVFLLQEKLFYNWKDTWAPDSFIDDAVDWMQGPGWLDNKNS